MQKKFEKTVVIVGGGFAGLAAARGLANKAVNVVLVDKTDHHTFQPLLYQVASTVLSPGQIAIPLRSILRRASNVEVLFDEVIDFNIEGRVVNLAKSEPIHYDYLVIAAGARHSYFGKDEWEKFAPGIKTIEDALSVRRMILSAFEDAEREAFNGATDINLTFAVVGGGPTGVELAGAIADIANMVLARDYRLIDTKKTKVILFEGAPRILGAFPEDLATRATEQLEQLGVEVRTNSQVTDMAERRLKVNQEWLSTRVMLWATGVAASNLGKSLPVTLDRAGRVPIQTDLSLKEATEIFVIGDMSSLKDAAGKVVPGLGSSAMQEGSHAAKNILADLSGKSRSPFTYFDKGTLATIGKHRAIAQFGKVKISGFIAWVAWALVHIALLVGFRNRFSVMADWIWSYITKQSSERIIIGQESKPPKPNN